MNRQALFQNAHLITKAAVRPGDNYQITFGAALRTLISLEKKAWNKAKERAEYFSERMGRVYISGRGWRDGLVNVGVHKTAEFYISACRIELANEILDSVKEQRQREEAEKARRAASARAATSPDRRYVTLETIAHRDGLNRGKSWLCGERDIQVKGALPEWEGQAICYVYS